VWRSTVALAALWSGQRAGRPGAQGRWRKRGGALVSLAETLDTERALTGALPRAVDMYSVARSFRDLPWSGTPSARSRNTHQRAVRMRVALSRCVDHGEVDQVAASGHADRWSLCDLTINRATRSESFARCFGSIWTPRRHVSRRRGDLAAGTSFAT